MRKRIGARATLRPEIQSRDARPAEIRVVWGDEHTGHAWHGRALFLSRRRKAACRYQSGLALLTVGDSTRPFGSTPVNPDASGKSLHLGSVLCGATGFRSPEEQLSHYDRRYEDFRCSTQLGQHSVVTLQKGTMLVSSRNLPLAGIHPLAFLFNRLDHFARGGVVQQSRERAQCLPAFALRREVPRDETNRSTCSCMPGLSFSTRAAISA